MVYTGGLTEAQEQYGTDRLFTVLERCGGVAPRELIAECLADLTSFLDGEERAYDLTVLALGRQ